MAWQYFLVCLFDFLLFPMLSMWWAHYSKTDYTPWVPISLKEGAFYHISMGAIIGISAWQRGQAILMRQYKEIKEETKDDQ